MVCSPYTGGSIASPDVKAAALRDSKYQNTALLRPDGVYNGSARLYLPQAAPAPLACAGWSLLASQEGLRGDGVGHDRMPCGRKNRELACKPSRAELWPKPTLSSRSSGAARAVVPRNKQRRLVAADLCNADCNPCSKPAQNSKTQRPLQNNPAIDERYDANTTSYSEGISLPHTMWSYQITILLDGLTSRLKNDSCIAHATASTNALSRAGE